MMDPGKCKPVSSIKNLTYFSSFCFLFLFSSFQDKKPLADVMSLFARQKGSFDCCFFVKFHWCHPHTNRNSLKNCSFHFPFVSISSGTTREAFWLSGRKLRSFFGTEVCLIVEFKGIFLPSFFVRKETATHSKILLFL